MRNACASPHPPHCFTPQAHLAGNTRRPKPLSPNRTALPRSQTARWPPATSRTPTGDGPTSEEDRWRSGDGITPKNIASRTRTARPPRPCRTRPSQNIARGGGTRASVHTHTPRSPSDSARERDRRRTPPRGGVRSARWNRRSKPKQGGKRREKKIPFFFFSLARTASRLRSPALPSFLACRCRLRCLNLTSPPTHSIPPRSRAAARGAANQPLPFFNTISCPARLTPTYN
ncbi:hypothetical protein PVAP13_7NG123817 [Panicum virgatum]|uniref:Uncharacterized protein n=1 Tax=Panicum virgatum TaxID=38727 RepID=A0A8T0PVK9_PANVG|nr:hypothetical protein PVAP13_7NG123817 [Panicum virgatum]